MSATHNFFGNGGTMFTFAGSTVTSYYGNDKDNNIIIVKENECYKGNNQILRGENHDTSFSVTGNGNRITGGSTVVCIGNGNSLDNIYHVYFKGNDNSINAVESIRGKGNGNAITSPSSLVVGNGNAIHHNGAKIKSSTPFPLKYDIVIKNGMSINDEYYQSCKPSFSSSSSSVICNEIERTTADFIENSGGNIITLSYNGNIIIGQQIGSNNIKKE